ncbi:MAG: IS200/IS605 family transposase [Muribaculaceae bacterium]|nr:IS200/IS605 family transposase [Muribaculaceae bacterium]
MSRNLLYYHLVFTPKYRQSVLDPEKERDLFAYIMGITNNLKGKLIRINAALNHIHILVRLPTTICPADYVANIKRASSLYIKDSRIFPKFWGWSREYSVETVSPELIPRIKQYIANQKEHHKVESFEDEWLRCLSEEERSRWDMKFFDN